MLSRAALTSQAVRLCATSLNRQHNGGRWHSCRPARRAARKAEASHTAESELQDFRAQVESKRFKCTQCGKCCTGPGEVWVTELECLQLAQHLGLTISQFLPRYTKSYSNKAGWRMLRSRGKDARCIFLDSEDLCSIHTQRPRQCSTYPWWPDLMESAAWDTEAERICEGMNHAEAEPCDVEDAAEQLRLATNHVNSRRAS